MKITNVYSSRPCLRNSASTAPTQLSSALIIAVSMRTVSFSIAGESFVVFVNRLDWTMRRVKRRVEKERFILVLGNEFHTRATEPVGQILVHGDGLTAVVQAAGPTGAVRRSVVLVTWRNARMRQLGSTKREPEGMRRKQSKPRSSGW